MQFEDDCVTTVLSVLTLGYTYFIHQKNACNFLYSYI